MRNSITRIAIAVLVISSYISPATTYAGDAPGFTLPGQNKTIQLSKYKGKVVYLDFWASWCEPCKRSFPWMNKLQEQYGENGFEIVAVNLDESRKDAETFLQKMPAKFDVAFDKSGKTAEAYNLKAMPSSFLIDREGKLVYKSLGYRAEEKKVVEKKIQQLVGKNVVATR
ncbi:MAG: TlpA disulfide reductase family protein [Gammaproteobacteria bacterium]|jgi:thiol-disulfide isomerase/thioredoxin